MTGKYCTKYCIARVLQCERARVLDAAFAVSVPLSLCTKLEVFCFSAAKAAQPSILFLLPSTCGIRSMRDVSNPAANSRISMMCTSQGLLTDALDLLTSYHIFAAGQR
jgi:hypothetical protein